MAAHSATALAGHVVVVAARVGADRAAVTLAAAGAAVAVITDDVDAVRNIEATVATSAPLLSFRADPTDTAVWERVAPHLEQRLGPVDAVVTDGESRAAATSTLVDDLRRRGHGDVVSIDVPDVAEEVRLAIHRTR